MSTRTASRPIEASMIDPSLGLPTISMAVPMPGFPAHREFVLVRLNEDGLLYAFTSIQDPELRFLVAPPEPFFPDYAPEIENEVFAALNTKDPDRLLLMTVITAGVDAETHRAIGDLPRGRGVLVVMNDWIHAAHSLTKTSTTAIQTFMSPLRGLVGVANYGKNDFYSSPTWKHTTQTEFDVSKVTSLPRVDIIFASADSSPDLIDAAAANGAKGIVIAGVGNGNMNKASLTAAANAVQKGVVVVRSSRVVTGVVGRNVEVNDDELGFVASDELNPQKARILLMLALMKQRNSKDLQGLFTTY